MFLFERQSIDTIRQDILHRARNMDIIDSQTRAVSSLFTHQEAGFDQRPHAFLGEEGIPFGPLD